MSSDLALVLSTFLIGIVAGLRSMTAPAIVSWAARLHRFDLSGSRLAFLASAAAVYIFSALGIGELIADKLPFVPHRTSPLPMVFRVLSGAICGVALCIAANRSSWRVLCSAGWALPTAHSVGFTFAGSW